MNSDSSLIQSILQGDIDLYETLVEKYRRRCMSYAARLLHDSSAAEDIVQEGFIRAYHALDRCRNTESFFSWLLSIIHNLCMDRHEAGRKEGSLIYRMKTASEVSYSSGYGGSPEARTMKKELIRVMNNEIQHLPVNYRCTLLLRYLFDLSYNEISQALNVPVGTVRSRLAEGKKILRLKIENELQ